MSNYPQSHPKHCEDGVAFPPPQDSRLFSCKPIDTINHPPHYTHGAIEAMDVIESWSLNFALGNVVKYVCRCDHKGDRLEQLQKASWYLNREIERERKLRE